MYACVHIQHTLLVQTTKLPKICMTKQSPKMHVRLYTNKYACMWYRGCSHIHRLHKTV